VRRTPIYTVADVLESITSHKKEVTNTDCSVVLSGLVEDQDPVADRANIDK
jgi:hypothetical protein